MTDIKDVPVSFKDAINMIVTNKVVKPKIQLIYSIRTHENKPRLDAAIFEFKFKRGDQYVQKLNQLPDWLEKPEHEVEYLRMNILKLLRGREGIVFITMPKVQTEEIDFPMPHTGSKKSKTIKEVQAECKDLSYRINLSYIAVQKNQLRDYKVRYIICKPAFMAGKSPSTINGNELNITVNAPSDEAAKSKIIEAVAAHFSIFPSDRTKWVIK